ncbi:hypothetical protein [Baaleninema simplex]|nr:hypothetical protein [Baaleninema simplex]
MTLFPSSSIFKGDRIYRSMEISDLEERCLCCDRLLISRLQGRFGSIHKS